MGCFETKIDYEFVGAIQQLSEAASSIADSLKKIEEKDKKAEPEISSLGMSKERVMRLFYNYVSANLKFIKEDDVRHALTGVRCDCTEKELKELGLWQLCYFSEQNESDDFEETPLTEAQLEKVEKELSDYMFHEFNNTFTLKDADIRNIGHAYTTLTDEEIPIQVTLDLVSMKLETYLDHHLVESIDYDYDTIMSGFRFDDLISGWQTRIEEGEFDHILQ